LIEGRLKTEGGDQRIALVLWARMWQGVKTGDSKGPHGNLMGRRRWELRNGKREDFPLGGGP